MRLKSYLLVAVVVLTVLGLSFFLHASRKPHSVTLTWTASPSAASYNIYRSETSGGPYQKIGNSPEAKFVDSAVTSGKVYYYVVTSISQNKESGYSSEIKAAVP